MSTPAECEPLSDAPRFPRRVVAVGGGTGLPTVLRGLKAMLPGKRETGALTAIVTMSDDGGSSGRLRRTMGVPPPGDVRNCLVALSEEEDLLTGLFQYRYGRSDELFGHSMGNLILAALAEKTGCFLRAVEVSSRVLRTVGRILPSTLDRISLVAEFEDGSRIEGETNVAGSGKRIRAVSLLPEDVKPTEGVLESIVEADLVVIGPGSLYTSVVPNLLVPGVSEALRETAAVTILVANLVSERGEASGLGLEEHLDVLEAHAGDRFLDGVLVHDGPIDESTLVRYELEGAVPLQWSEPSARGIPVKRANLLAVGPKLRHDPDRTVSKLMELWAELTLARRRGPVT